VEAHPRIGCAVYPSYGRPHYLKSAGPERGVYVRVGSSNRQADRELIAELRRFASGESYDEEPLPDLDSEPLTSSCSELFASKRKLKKTDLDTLRIVTKHQGRRVPTVGGVCSSARTRTTFPRRLDFKPDALTGSTRCA